MLPDTFTIVDRLLHTYAPGRAYVEVDQWHGISCQSGQQRHLHRREFYCGHTASNAQGVDERDVAGHVAAAPRAPVRPPPAAKQPIASIVTVRPLGFKSFSSSGIAVISLDLSSTATCASISPFSLDHAVTMCKGGQIGPLAMRPTQRLAIDGDQLAAGGFRQRLRPSQQTDRELLPLDQTKHATKRVVRGNPTRQFQELSQPDRARFGKHLHVRPVVGAAQHRQNRDRQNVQKLMLATIDHTWVRQVVKALPHTIHKSLS
jgi:hypothetical protein